MSQTTTVSIPRSLKDLINETINATGLFNNVPDFVRTSIRHELERLKKED